MWPDRAQVFNYDQPTIAVAASLHTVQSPPLPAYFLPPPALMCGQFRAAARTRPRQTALASRLITRRCPGNRGTPPTNAEADATHLSSSTTPLLCAPPPQPFTAVAAVAAAARVSLLLLGLLLVTCARNDPVTCACNV